MTKKCSCSSETPLKDFWKNLSPLWILEELLEDATEKWISLWVLNLPPSLAQLYIAYRMQTPELLAI